MKQNFKMYKFYKILNFYSLKLCIKNNFMNQMILKCTKLGLQCGAKAKAKAQKKTSQRSNVIYIYIYIYIYEVIFK